MEQLRIILIVLGVLLVAGIWLAERIRRRRSEPPRHWNELELDEEHDVDEVQRFSTDEAGPMPDEWVGKAFSARRHDVLDDEQLESLKGLGSDDEAGVEETAAPAGGGGQEGVATPAPMPAEEVIVLTLLAPQGRQLRGPLLLKALQEAGLAHGDMEIFHYAVEGHREPLFSVANILEPGRFVLAEMAQLETPGVALFMRLPAVMPGDEALKLMLQKAHQMAAQLNASLCDGQRQPLDDKALTALEKRAVRFRAET